MRTHNVNELEKVVEVHLLTTTRRASKSMEPKAKVLPGSQISC